LSRGPRPSFALTRTLIALSLSVAGLLALAPEAPAVARTARDRDHDGLPDRWEHRYHLSTARRSRAGDPDRDRVANAVEYRHRLSPRRWDTDGDGLSDGYELRRSRTNPRRRDTDGDGLSDGYEVRVGTNPSRADGQPSLLPVEPGSASPPGQSAVTSPDISVPDLPTTPPSPPTILPEFPPNPTYYVDRYSVGGQCDDSRPRQEVTLNTPWCSLDRGIAAAPSGSTVLVRRGAYPAFAISGKRTDYVTVTPYPSEHVTLMDGLTVEDPQYEQTHTRTLNAAYLRFEGFRISGQVRALFGADHIEIVGNDISPHGVYVRLAWDVLVEGNYIHDLVYGEKAIGADGWEQPQYAASVGGVRNLTIRGNHLARLNGDGVTSNNGERNLLIEGNEIEEARYTGDPNNHVDSIQIAGGDYGAHGVTISDNLIHDNSYGILVGDGRSDDVTIRDNSIFRIEALGIDLWNTHEANVVHNTTWDTGWGMRVGYDSNGISVTRNVLDWLHTSSGTISTRDYNLIAHRDGNASAPHDPSGTPQFIDAAGLDYRLASGSPGYTDRLGTDVDPDQMQSPP
jgi:hypothetical protein